MKKQLILVLVFVFGFVPCFGFAYTSTIEEQKQLEGLEMQLYGIIGEDNIKLRDLYYQLKNLHVRFQVDGKLNYFLGELKTSLYTTLQARKNVVTDDSFAYKTKFLATFQNNLIDYENILPQCLEYYNLVDDISFAYNFPTALTIATWYRESTCGFYLPGNGDGPFQIVNEDYGIGEISEQLFVETLIDFIEFSRNKHYRYWSKADFNLYYGDFSFVSIVNHLALYNGGTISNGIVIPNNPKYVFDNYTSDYANAVNDGVFPIFLKILHWELEKIER